MRKLYFEGPSSLFWANRTSEDICSDLTNIRSSHWINNMEICEELKNSSFNSFYIAVNSFMYFTTLIVFIYTSLIYIYVHLVIRRFT